MKQLALGLSVLCCYSVTHCTAWGKLCFGAWCMVPVVCGPSVCDQLIVMASILGASSITMCCSREGPHLLGECLLHKSHNGTECVKPVGGTHYMRIVASHSASCSLSTLQSFLPQLLRQRA